MSDLIRQQNWGVSTAAQTNVTASFRATPTEGNLLVGACFGATADHTDISPPGGWTEAVSRSNTGVSGRMYYKRAGAAESTSVAFTTAAGLAKRLYVWEIKGVLASGTLLDVTASNGSGSPSVSTISSGTTGTTAQADEIAVCVIGLNNTPGKVLSWSQDFEMLMDLDATIDASGATNLASTKLLNATGTVETTATWVDARRACALLATFKLASSPTFPNPRHRRVAFGTESAAQNTDASVATQTQFAVMTDRLYLACVAVVKDASSPTTAIPASHGGALTWTQVAGVGTNRRLDLYQATSASDLAAAAITITTSETGVDVWWLVVEVYGAGAASVIQSKAVDVVIDTFREITFDALPDAANAVAGFLLHGASDKHDHDAAPHLLLAELNTGGSSKRTSAQWFAGSDQTLRWDWTTSTHSLGVIVEVAAQAGSAVTGAIAVAQDNQTGAFSGIVANPVTGTIASIQANQIAALTGTVTLPTTITLPTTSTMSDADHEAAVGSKDRTAVPISADRTGTIRP